MIYDCFYLLDELDLLEIRLGLLDSVVDKFIIVESNETFSGVSKTLHFKENEERFSKWRHKIIYYVVNDYPNDEKLYNMAYASPNTGDKSDYWLEEFYQKESLQKALVGLDEEDLVFISDIDEIWNPNILPITGDEVYRPIQLSYMYYLNNRTDLNWQEGWTGTIATKYKNIKNACINHLRTDEVTPYVPIENGGWHFCSLGGIEQKKKSWNNPKMDIFDSTVQAKREKGSRIDESDLPEFLLNNREKYAKYWK